MVNLPRPTGKEMIAFLQRQGHVVLRVQGSHHVLRRGNLLTTVLVHGSETLRIGTLRKILRDIEMEPADVIRRWHA